MTPEATAAVCERLIPGFSEQMRAAGREKNAAGNSFARRRRHSWAGNHHQSAGQSAGSEWNLSIRLPICCRTPCGRASRRAPRIVRATCLTASNAALLIRCKLGFCALNSPGLDTVSAIDLRQPFLLRRNLNESDAKAEPEASASKSRTKSKPKNYRDALQLKEAFVIPEQMEAQRELVANTQEYDPDLFLWKVQTDPNGPVHNRLIDLYEMRMQEMDKYDVDVQPAYSR